MTTTGGRPIIRRRAELHKAARRLCRRGLSVIPVGRDKKPLVKWERYQKAPADNKQVDEWWTRWPDANVGVVTGAVSGLVALDADGPEGLASLTALGTPATTWLSRTGRGLHQFFRHPGVPIGNRAGLRPRLDVRGDGGYVIVPPSRHASGRRYAWLTPPDFVNLAPIPDHVLDLLRANGSGPVNGNGPRYRNPREIPEGRRNDALYRLGRSLVAKGLTPAAVAAALFEENLAKCRPPLSDDEVQAIAGHAATQPDRPGFAPATSAPADGSADAVEWPAPEPVPNELPAVPPFDAARLLPAAFGPWVSDIAERAQCPADFVAVAAVVAAAGVVGRALVIRPKTHDDWAVVPNLWGLAIGRPGVMKSSALAEALRPVYRLVADARRAYQAAQRDQEFRSAEAQARRDAAKKKLKEAVELGRLTGKLRAAFEASGDRPPTERRYLVNDSTVEKLGELLNQTPRGLLLYRDELIGFLRTLDREGHENDRAFYCEAWNGTGSYTYDRIGRGTIQVDAACVSILGGIQPGPLHAYLREMFGDGARDDGLIQRFQVMVYPDVAREWRNVDRWPDTQARRRVDEIFQRLARLAPADLAAREPAEPEALPFLRFAPEAQGRFDAWRAELERDIRGGDEHPVVVSHLAKYRSLLPSLALIFHVIDCADRGGGGPVSDAATERAVTWCEYLAAHARRVYHSVTAGARVAAAGLAAKIAAGALPDPFRARDVRRHAWAGLTEPDEVFGAIDWLVDLYWLRREDVRAPGGGRPTAQYRINPAARVSAVLAVRQGAYIPGTPPARATLTKASSSSVVPGREYPPRVTDETGKTGLRYRVRGHDGGPGRPA